MANNLVAHILLYRNFELEKPHFAHEVPTFLAESRKRLIYFLTGQMITILFDLHKDSLESHFFILT